MDRVGHNRNTMRIWYAEDALNEAVMMVQFIMLCGVWLWSSLWLKLAFLMNCLQGEAKVTPKPHTSQCTTILPITHYALHVLTLTVLTGSRILAYAVWWSRTSLWAVASVMEPALCEAKMTSDK